MGLESIYDEVLNGKPGMIKYESDLFGYETPTSQAHFEPPVDGQSLQLTLDENIQIYMESALTEVMQQYNPQSISAIAADPHTMEILGMVSLPGYNPNEYWNIKNFTNHVIGSQYEPASTFKIITLAAAVEEGLFDPDREFQSGSIQVPGDRIHDHNISGWGKISYLEGVRKSSNVLFVKLGYEMLGKELLREYIDQFGFGSISQIDLPGEVSGRINFNYPSEVATATFGQGITVTAIQQLAAISAIANGGKLMQPYLVDQVLDTNTGEIINRHEPQVVRQVISEETAYETTMYLEQVISEEGATGHGAYLEDYRMAGKTGTAQKVVNGKYSKDEYVVSFIGFAPVENPQVALFISIDAPEIQGDYRLAGRVAAPVFKEIMSKTLRYLGVSASKISSGEAIPEVVEVPDVVDQSHAAANNKLSILNLQTETLGAGDRILKQYPEPGESLVSGGTVYLLTRDANDVELPDLTGKSMRDALQVCGLLNIACEIEGSGYVVQQMEVSARDREWRLTLAKPGEEEEVSADPDGEMDENMDANPDDMDDAEDTDLDDMVIE